MDVNIVRLTREDAWAQRNEAGEIYRRAFGCTPAESDGFVNGSFAHIRDYPGATLLLATVESKPVGMLYGYTYQPGQWWAQRVGAAIISAGFRHYLDDAFSLVELAVLPDFQGRGIGSKLLTYQMRHQSQDHILLSTDAADENRAIDFYRRHGLEVIVSLFRYSENGSPAHIMGARCEANSTKC